RPSDPRPRPAYLCRGASPTCNRAFTRNRNPADLGRRRRIADTVRLDRRALPRPADLAAADTCLRPSEPRLHDGRTWQPRAGLGRLGGRHVIQVERRPLAPTVLVAVASVIAAIVPLIISMLLLALMGVSVPSLVGSMLAATFGSPRAIADVIGLAAPLMLTG